jgi:hypothetical protein
MRWNSSLPTRSAYLLDVGHDRVRGVLVVLALGQIQQFAGFGQAIDQFAHRGDQLVEHGALAAQGLGALGIVPDIRVFEFAGNFFKPFDLQVEVKDTP